MVKLNDEIVDILFLLDSKDEKLQDLIKLFLSELRDKESNIVYNLIPKALAKISKDYKEMSYETFKKVIKELINNIEKEKKVESLIDLLISKLKSNNNINEWRNYSYCFTLLKYSEKNIERLIENYLDMKDIIQDDIVTKNFSKIFEKAKNTVDKEKLRDLKEGFKKVLGANFDAENTSKKGGKRKDSDASSIKSGKKERIQENDININDIESENNINIKEEEEIDERQLLRKKLKGRKRGIKEAEDDLHSVGSKKSKVSRNKSKSKSKNEKISKESKLSLQFNYMFSNNKLNNNILDDDDEDN